MAAAKEAGQNGSLTHIDAAVQTEYERIAEDDEPSKSSGLRRVQVLDHKEMM